MTTNNEKAVAPKVTRSEREAFAQCVLEILAEHEEWNADTVDAIATKAFDLGLATLNKDGWFRIRVKPAVGNRDTRSQAANGCANKEHLSADGDVF